MKNSILPEYKSNVSIIKHLFYKRISEAIKLAYFKDYYNILDIGAGTGLLLKILRRKKDLTLGVDIKKGNLKLYGCDINHEIMKLRFGKGINLQLANVNHLPYKNQSFDIIYCLDVLEHLKDLEQAILEIKRVLKASGQLIVSVPTENIIYKIGRFLIKGTFSNINGPASGPHYWNANYIRKVLNNHFFFKKKIVLLNPILDFFWIMKYENIK